MEKLLEGTETKEGTQALHIQQILGESNLSNAQKFFIINAFGSLIKTIDQLRQDVRIARWEVRQNAETVLQLMHEADLND